MKPNLKVMLNPNHGEFETHACTQNIDMETRVRLNKVIEMSMKCVFEKLYDMCTQANGNKTLGKHVAMC